MMQVIGIATVVSLSIYTMFAGIALVLMAGFSGSRTEKLVGAVVFLIGLAALLLVLHLNLEVSLS